MKLNPTHKIFISEGCNDWKNAFSRFKLDQTSKLHLNSTYVMNQELRATVVLQLLSSTKKHQEQRRQAFFIKISSIMYLLRQGLALRGQSDENCNLIQLVKLRSIDQDCLKDWIDNKKYLSHDIVNEIYKEIYLTIIRDIVKEVCEI
ncbi:unnamed protein product [Adineta steineri]|uniref:Uncharacterized protein n=2 Tax=Adineta steineri TaxID=433720 RepID=A0A814IXS6_9BILA|nr:unnamed protein product [Adineta steineri]CAF1030529.1 unnamed protein product [Adineta steineri]